MYRYEAPRLKCTGTQFFARQSLFGQTKVGSFTFGTSGRWNDPPQWPHSKITRFTNTSKNRGTMAFFTAARRAHSARLSGDGSSHTAHAHEEKDIIIMMPIKSKRK